MCECAGKYKCWRHFMASHSHSGMTGREKIAAFHAQPKPSVWVDSEIEAAWADYFDTVPAPVPPVPLVKEADPELERLLAEEEEIDSRHAFNTAPNAIHNVGDLRRALRPFSEDMDLSSVVQVRFEQDIHHGSSLNIVRWGDDS